MTDECKEILMEDEVDQQDYYNTELQNWLRWSKSKDWLPMRHKSTLVFLSYLAGTVVSEENTSEEYRPPLRLLDALVFDDLVINLPNSNVAKYRDVFIVYHLHKYIRQSTKVISTYRLPDKLAAVGMKKDMFYNRLAMAEAMIKRGLDSAK